MARKYTIRDKPIGRPKLPRQGVTMHVPYEILEQVLVWKAQVLADRDKKRAALKPRVVRLGI